MQGDAGYISLSDYSFLWMSGRFLKDFGQDAGLILKCSYFHMNIVGFVNKYSSFSYISGLLCCRSFQSSGSNGVGQHAGCKSTEEGCFFSRLSCVCWSNTWSGSHHDAHTGQWCSRFVVSPVFRIVLFWCTYVFLYHGTQAYDLKRISMSQ